MITREKLRLTKDDKKILDFLMLHFEFRESKPEIIHALSIWSFVVPRQYDYIELIDEFPFKIAYYLLTLYMSDQYTKFVETDFHYYNNVIGESKTIKENNK